MLIALSEDEEEEVSLLSKTALTQISNSFSSDESKGLLENLEETFYSTISALPRTFNRKGVTFVEIQLKYSYVYLFCEL